LVINTEAPIVALCGNQAQAWIFHVGDRVGPSVTGLAF
jgi:hypothetical protein